MKKLAVALAMACAGSVLWVPSTVAQGIDQGGAVAPVSQAGSGAWPVVLTKPTDIHNWGDWSRYLTGLVWQQSHTTLLRYRAYQLFVPAGNDSEDVGGRQRQLENVRNILASGIKPGLIVVTFGGPSSQATADFILTAFKDMPPRSLRGVAMMFVGLEADKARVFARWQACGASTHFVDLQSNSYEPRQLPVVPAESYFVMPPPPPPPPPPPAPIPPPAAIGTSDTAGNPHQSQAPIYPGFEAVYGIEGRTMLLILVGKTGQPEDIKVAESSGQRDLDRAAIDAAIHWRFHPAIKNGTAADGYVRIPVSFNTDSSTDEQWPRSYLGADLVWDETPLPYASVGEAMNAVATQVHEPAYDDHKKHFQSYAVYSEDGRMRERWYFMDVSSPKAMAVRYSFVGTAEHPHIQVSALCDDAAVCRNRKSWITGAPHSLSLARKGNAAA
ncbi:energy transducer TonB [Dyella acidiphila]|uniref:Energy transducer TonB n=1 Tax=Dyella acidiphila TaxID=2775866 RepID=A0ABR9GDR9_9GAMM|nr:energy transducer TonB [Dyella acidiphila]MBE1162196.1 energy transducer TonB [Dyella acidiphila]